MPGREKAGWEGRLLTPACAIAKTLAEALNAATGVENLLFAGIKRMARGAHLQMNIFLQGGAGGYHVAAAAGRLDFPIFRVDV